MEPVISPIISIVTPTRNRPELLERSIESVRAQSLQAWEMIVVEDGDGTGLRMVELIDDPRVIAVLNPGSGHVEARNMALELSRGGFIHLLDDDDRWCDPQHLERVVKALLRTPGLAFRHGWLVHEDNFGDGWLEVGREVFAPPTTRESLRHDNTILTSGVAYPRALHRMLGRFDTQMGNYWDWDWFLRASESVPLLEIPDPAVLMSWRGSGLPGSNLQANTSANPFKPERLRFLERLIAKHGLTGVTPKNHATVLEAESLMVTV
jgi:glycosyltransferase involved in cell wall biosynthesis